MQERQSLSTVDAFLGDNSYLISVSGNIYTFTNENPEGQNWAFTVENGRVVSLKYDSEEYPWTYNADGQLTSFQVDDVEPYSIAYDNGNYDNEHEYGEELVTKSDEIDFLLMLDQYTTLNYYEVNSDPLYAAMLLGWAGRPSKNFATGYQGDPVEYATPNASGYIPSVDFMEGMMNIVCEYK